MVPQRLLGNEASGERFEIKKSKEMESLCLRVYTYRDWIPCLYMEETTLALIDWPINVLCWCLLKRIHFVLYVYILRWLALRGLLHGAVTATGDTRPRARC